MFSRCAGRAVFQVVERHSGSQGRQSLTGRLNLVDLAGSERPRLTGAERTPGMGWDGLEGTKDSHGKTIGKPWENHRKTMGKP